MPDFQIGIVTVEVVMRNGQHVLEDWNPEDADAARDYAAETALCSDVVRTEFRNNRSGESQSYGIAASRTPGMPGRDGGQQG